MNDRIIDEYLKEVTADMGPRQRSDVARELRTHILDSADALAAERKTTIDDAILREVITKMGPARKVAALYPTPKAFFETKELRGMWNAVKALVGIGVMFALVGLILLVMSPDTLDIAAVSVVFNVVFALGIAAVVIAIVFLAMYTYETRLKSTYEDRLKRLEQSLHEAASPLKVFAAIFGVTVWLVLLNVYWTKLPFVTSFEGTSTLVPVLSPDFGRFVLWFNVLGMAGIVVQLSYLALRQKWVPALLETIVGVCTALLFAGIMAALPFNPALSTDVVTALKVFLAVVIAASLFGAGKNLREAARLFLNRQRHSPGAV